MRFGCESLRMRIQCERYESNPIRIQCASKSLFFPSVKGPKETQPCGALHTIGAEPKFSIIMPTLYMFSLHIKKALFVTQSHY